MLLWLGRALFREEPQRESCVGRRCNFGSMLKVVDAGMHNITQALRAKALWAETLMIVSSDNGGVGPGNK